MRAGSMTTPDSRKEPQRTDSVGDWPDNPVLTRVLRGGRVESQHRGAWVLVDSSGAVLESYGRFEHPVFARSSIKSLQALPLLESGAAERFGFEDDELALAMASHSGEARHVERVERMLRRIGLRAADLQCGAEPPWDGEARRELIRAGVEANAMHHNCSGKHSGFLALSLHLDVDPRRYLDPESPGQVLVREAVNDMTGAAEGQLTTAVDGCSAPTFRLPLDRLATGLARVANPEGLPSARRSACERMGRAVAAWPELIAGSRKRICTDLARASGGRLFPKLGGEAVYGIGVRGLDRGLALKVDDGNHRGFHALIVELCTRFGLLDESEAAGLARWRERSIKNSAGLEVGTVEVVG